MVMVNDRTASMSFALRASCSHTFVLMVGASMFSGFRFRVTLVGAPTCSRMFLAVSCWFHSRRKTNHLSRYPFACSDQSDKQFSHMSQKDAKGAKG